MQIFLALYRLPVTAPALNPVLGQNLFYPLDERSACLLDAEEEGVDKVALNLEQEVCLWQAHTLVALEEVSVIIVVAALEPLWGEVAGEEDVFEYVANLRFQLTLKWYL